MAYCKNCGAELTDEGVKVCPNCGKNVMAETDSKSSNSKILIIACAAVIAVGIVTFGAVKILGSKDTVKTDSETPNQPSSSVVNVDNDDTDNNTNPSEETNESDTSAVESDSTDDNTPPEEQYELKEGRYPVIDGKVQVWLPTEIKVESNNSNPEASGTAFSIKYNENGLMTEYTWYEGSHLYIREEDKLSYNNDITPNSIFVKSYVAGELSWQEDRLGSFKSTVLPMEQITSYYSREETHSISYTEDGLVDTFGDNKVTYNENGNPETLTYFDGFSIGDYFEYTYNESNLLSHVERIEIRKNEDSDRIPFGDYYVNSDYEEEITTYDMTYDDNGYLIEFVSNWEGDNIEVFTLDYELFEIDEQYWEYYRDYYLFNWIDTLIFTYDANEHYISYINDGVFQNFLLNQLSN